MRPIKLSRIVIRSATVVRSWLERWNDSARSIWEAQVPEGLPPLVVCEVTVPGASKDDAENPNKGNVVMLVPTEEVDDMMEELLLQANEGRPATAAEVVRKTATWIDIGTEDAPNLIFSFKVSEAPGSRTIKVAESDLPLFLTGLNLRFKSLIVQWNDAHPDK